MIAPTEIANGSLSDDGQTVWTHLGCLRLWREEARTYEVNQIERERDARAELCATVRDGFASAFASRPGSEWPMLGVSSSHFTK